MFEIVCWLPKKIKLKSKFSDCKAQEIQRVILHGRAWDFHIHILY